MGSGACQKRVRGEEQEICVIQPVLAGETEERERESGGVEWEEGGGGDSGRQPRGGFSQ